MSAVARQRAKPQVYELQSGTLEKLAQLAERDDLSSSLKLQALIAEAYDGVVLELSLASKPFAQLFIPRLRELAAQPSHPPREVRTSFYFTEDYADAIRKLRDVLSLPRRDLVVEYLVQAAWGIRRDDDPDGGKKSGPLERGRRLARFHNVDELDSAATVGGRVLFFTPSTQLHLRGLEEVPKPKT